SSRRRHTRFSRDWSSDVCSSDLLLVVADLVGRLGDLGELVAVAHEHGVNQLRPLLGEPLVARFATDRVRVARDEHRVPWPLLVEIGRASCRGWGEMWRAAG